MSNWMTEEEYVVYEATVASFFEKSGVTNLTIGHIRCPQCNAEWVGDGDYECPNGHGKKWQWDEPHISMGPCDVCKSPGMQEFEHATGIRLGDLGKTEIVEFEDVCSDCSHYVEYGC